MSLSILSIARLSTVTMHEQLCISAPGVPDILCHLQILASCNNIYSLTHFIRPIPTLCFSFELVQLESKRPWFFRISLVCLREYLFRPIPLPSSLSFASLRLRFLPLWALEPFYAQLVNKSHSPAFSTQSSLLNIRQTFNSQIHSCSLTQGL